MKNLTWKNSSFSNAPNRHFKTTESGGVRGYDAGKKVKGRKRHIIADTNGFLVMPSSTAPTYNQNRRLAKDFDFTIASATAWLFMASVKLLARRIAIP